MLKSKYIKHAALASLLIFGTAAYAAADSSTIGLEGFYDNYREPEEGTHVNNHAIYGSLTGTYVHNMTPDYFWAADGRGSYGSDHYHSASGTDTNVPQMEGEIRLRTGINAAFAGGELMPYIGLGTRLYYDDFSNKPGGYTRAIEQIYAPVGVTYKYITGGLLLAPTVEYDPLIYGHVYSGLKPYIGTDINNHQHSGYGLRSEFMVGQDNNGYGWQVGPFIRYWNINNSTVNDGYYEPKNNRVQAGVALRLDY